jgi:hypothetical protein
MGSPSHRSNGDREHCERLAASAVELLQLVTAVLQGAPTPLDLLVDTINALLDDAVELAPRSVQPGTELSKVTLPTRDFPRPPTQPAAKLTWICQQVHTVSAGLKAAVGSAKNDFDTLAHTEGPADPALLHRITVTLRSIQACRNNLTQLAYERNLAVSAWFADPHVSPANALDARTTPAAQIPRLAPSTRIVPSPAAPPPPPVSPADCEPNRRHRITGPGGAL